MGRSRRDSERQRRRNPSETSCSSSSSSETSASPPRKSSGSMHRGSAEVSRRRSRGDNEDHEQSQPVEMEKRKRRRRNKEVGERVRCQHSRHRHNRKLDRRHHSSDSESGHSIDAGDSESDHFIDPKEATGRVLHKFPGVAGELKQLLEMIDKGQGVDVKGISNKSLRKLLKKLFVSLKLESTGGIFILPPSGVPTLDVIGSLIKTHSSLPRRLIGPEMPSRELLVAAAELTEAETLLREADYEMENSLFIGPPPPSMVSEAESTNEAERFEEVARISSADINKPYDVLGANWKMSFDNIKKRYWKLSLMVHPDKCSHPDSHKAFITLNKAFKELQDPEKRNEIDEKLKLKEEQEQFMVELKSMREAAQWRRLQGISMDGDEELLADQKEPPKRDEWMTTLPPERKPGMSMHSTSFSRSGKDGRGDTSVWTDSPMDKAEKAKQNYLEAYEKANLLANTSDVKRRAESDANLIDKYNASKRGKSLVKKHQEDSSKAKKKSKKMDKEEWQGQHPWKPWDREKDLGAGRSKINFDSESMKQGLSSRFSSGVSQRKFL